MAKQAAEMAQRRHSSSRSPSFGWDLEGAHGLPRVPMACPGCPGMISPSASHIYIYIHTINKCIYIYMCVCVYVYIYICIMWLYYIYRTIACIIIMVIQYVLLPMVIYILVCIIVILCISICFYCFCSPFCTRVVLLLQCIWFAVVADCVVMIIYYCRHKSVCVISWLLLIIFSIHDFIAIVIL